MKRWKLLTLLATLLVVACGFGLIASGVLPYRLYVVHTGSMEPTIPSTSAVLVRVGQYKVGQPISFNEQGGVITHRLMRINADGTIDTKGDANATDDPWHVPTSAIIGGVVAHPMGVGYWLVFFKNPLGLACVFLSVLVCWQIWAIAGADGSTRTTRDGNDAPDAETVGPREAAEITAAGRVPARA